MIPRLRERLLRQATVGYVRVVAPALVLAAGLALAVSTIDADAVRWLSIGVLTILQPLFVLRALPSMNTDDVDALVRLLPRRFDVAVAPVRRMIRER